MMRVTPTMAQIGGSVGRIGVTCECPRFPETEGAGDGLGRGQPLILLLPLLFSVVAFAYQTPKQ